MSLFSFLTPPAQPPRTGGPLGIRASAPFRPHRLARSPGSAPTAALSLAASRRPHGTATAHVQTKQPPPSLPLSSPAVRHRAHVRESRTVEEANTQKIFRTKDSPGGPCFQLLQFANALGSHGAHHRTPLREAQVCQEPGPAALDATAAPPRPLTPVLLHPEPRASSGDSTWA